MTGIPRELYPSMTLMWYTPFYITCGWDIRCGFSSSIHTIYIWMQYLTLYLRFWRESNTLSRKPCLNIVTSLLWRPMRTHHHTSTKYIHKIHLIRAVGENKMYFVSTRVRYFISAIIRCGTSNSLARDKYIIWNSYFFA